MSYSKKEAIELLRKITDDLGHAPSQSEFEEYTGDGWWSIGKKFDGWNAAKEAAGLDTYQGGHETVYSKRDIENQIQNVTEKLGYVPNAHEFNQRNDSCTLDVVQKRFGTWNNAVESAGFEPNRATYDHNSEYFSTIDTPANAYWLGVLFADGHVRVKDSGRNVVGLTSADTDHLKKFRNEVSPNKPLHDLNSGWAVQQVEVSDELMASDLKDHGLDTRTVPDIQRQLRPHFIRGFFDGDGSAADRIALYNGNKSLLESIASWAPTDDYRLDTVNRDEYSTEYSLNFRQEGTIATVEWMYPGGTDTQPALPRKRAKANEYTQTEQ